MDSADWDPFRDEIFGLYYDKKWTLKEVKQHMEQKYRLRVKERQYKYLFKGSGKSKYKPRHNLARRCGHIQKRSSNGQASSSLELRTSPLTYQGEDVANLDTLPEALSQHDYGRLSVLNRQSLLQGIPAPGRDIMGFSALSDSELILSNNSTCQIALCSIFEQQNIPRTPSHSWAIESLISILSSDKLDPIRQKTPGFPKCKNDLQCCPPTDLLNISVSVIINGLSDYCYDLMDWFMNDEHDLLLLKLLNTESERLLSFAYNLIIVIGISEFIIHKEPNRQHQLRNSSKAAHTARLGLSALQYSIKGQYSRFNFSKLLHTIGSLDIPDVAEKLLDATAIKDSDALHYAFYCEQWRIAKVLLNHGHTLHRLVGSFWFNGHPKEIRRVAQLFQIFLSQIQIRDHEKGALDRVVHGTDPFTLSEAISLYSSPLANMLQPWVTDPISLRVCKVLSIPFDSYYQFVPPWMYELRLLMAVRFNDADLTRELLQSGVDPNCPNLQDSAMAVDCLGGNILQGIKDRFERAIEARSFILLEDNLIQSLPYLPLAWAFILHNATVSTLLIRANAAITEEMLEVVFRWVFDEHEFVYTLLPILAQSHLMNHYAHHHRLGFAILREDLDVLIGLAPSDADLNRPISISYLRDPITVFAFALAFCGSPIVEFLWERTGRKFFHESQHSGAFEMIQLLSTASRQTFPELETNMSFLINQGAYLNSPCDIDGLRTGGNTPLQELLSQTELNHNHSNCALESVEFLVSKGADVDARSSSGPTPLQLASSHQQFDVVRYLVGKGADIDLVRGMSELGDPVLSVLGQACLSCNFDIVCLLIENKADINVRSSYYNNTPLHHACNALSPSLVIVQYLIENGADVNAVSDRHTVLQEACQTGFFDAVLLFIEKEVDVNAASGPQGLGTAIEIAAQRGYFDIVKLLVNAGAEKVVTENRFARAIQLAGSHIHIVDYLETERARYSSESISGMERNTFSNNFEH